MNSKKITMFTILLTVALFAMTGCSKKLKGGENSTSLQAPTGVKISFTMPGICNPNVGR